MKKKLLILSSLLLNYPALSDDNSTAVTEPVPTPEPSQRVRVPPVIQSPLPPGHEPPPKFAEDDPILQAFSPKAVELLWAYNPQGGSPLNHVMLFFYPAPNKEKHYKEEYRPAWEELFREVVLDGVHAKKIRFKNNSTRSLREVRSGTGGWGDGQKGITSALSEIASINSIPMFVDVYTQLLEQNKDEKKERQRDILGILFNINAPEALNTVFSLLDLTENKIGAEPAATLREAILKDLEQALQKRDKLSAYQNPNLSVNNKALLDNARQPKNKE